jgi:hypothetical protein
MSYICKNCGSKDVEFKAWVSANTGIKSTTEYLEQSEDDETWCNKCETHGGIEEV